MVKLLNYSMKKKAFITLFPLVLLFVTSLFSIQQGPTCPLINFGDYNNRDTCWRLIVYYYS